MVRYCINCTYPLLSSKSEFCSWNCSQEYDNFEHIQHTEERKIMAVKTETIVHITDDLTGTEDATAETLAFSLEGVNYEIDLGDKNAATFRKAFDKYVKVARVKAARGRKPGSVNTETTAIREWAKANHLDVNDRGRVPANIVDLYRAAHPATDA